MIKLTNFTNPILDEVKTKLMGWIANHKPKSPKSNLTKLELRGRKWIIDKMNSELIICTCIPSTCIIL